MGADAETKREMREVLGRRVREVWLEWARVQPDAKRSWINGWNDIEERHREVDRDIGEVLFEMGRQSVVDELLASVEAWRTKLADLDPTSFPDEAAAAEAANVRRVAVQVLSRVTELLEARHVEGTRLAVPKVLL